MELVKSGNAEYEEYEVERSKKIYRRLAKLLHPDINPQTDLSAKLTELKDEIRGITNTEPYTHGALLADEQAVEEKKAELNKELESYQRYAEELDAVITSILESGGLSFLWKI